MASVLGDPVSDRPRRSGYTNRRFVAGGLGAASPRGSLLGPDVLGGAAFRDRVPEAAGAASPEVPGRARRMTPEALDVPRARHPERAEWMARAYRNNGHGLRRIAERRACTTARYPRSSRHGKKEGVQKARPDPETFDP